MTDSPIHAPGWQALDNLFCAHYPDALPHQFTSPTPYQLDSPHPLPAITVFEAPRAGPRPAYWHFVSYGLSELFEKTTEDPEHSGLGYELCFAIERGQDEPQPPSFALALLQGIAGHALNGQISLDSGVCVNLGHSLLGSGTQAPDAPCGCICLPDPAVTGMQGPFGRVLFLRLLGLCEDELSLCTTLDLAPKVSMLAELSPHAITDPTRRPWSEDPQKAKILRRFRLGLEL